MSASAPALETPVLGAPVQETPATPEKPLWGLVPYLFAQRRLFWVTCLVGVASHALAALAATSGAWAVGLAVGAWQTGTAANLGPVLVLLAASSVGAALARWWQFILVHDLAFRILAETRTDLFDGLERAAPAYTLGRRTGDLAATAMGDVEIMEIFYAHIAAEYVGAVLVPAGALVFLAALHPALALALLPFLVLVATVPFWLAQRAGAQGDRLRAALGTLNAEVVDGVQGLRELVVFGQGDAFDERLRRDTRAFQRHQLAYGRRSGLELAIADALLALGLGTVLVMAAALVTGGGLAAPLLPVAVVLAGAALAPLSQLTRVARSLGQIRGSAARIVTILRQPARVADAPAAALTASEAGRLEPGVRFEGVTFRYAAGREAALDGVDFEVAPGETVALVGHSGAGKSTCANLLLRFWDPDAGRITIGGRDLRAIPLAELRSLIAYVPQDVYHFNESLRDNIRLGRPEATDSEVEHAARLAMAHDFIVALPEGYDTIGGERGAQLSGGQRQRIAIARALLMDAPILLLDEAVSNLDAEGEQALRATLQGLARRRTILIIAHRLSTIRGADRIVVLDRGRVAETGTDAELLARDGVYRRLVAAQRGGVVGERL